MILGRGPGQTDEEIIADYFQCLEAVGHIENAAWLTEVQRVPALLRRRIGKPILRWSDADLLAVYEGRGDATTVRYSNFLAFLFLRGYRRADLEFLMALPFNLHQQWRKAYVPYQQRLQQTVRELGYTGENSHVSLITYLITLLVISGKPLEEITRADYEAFHHQWDQWYQNRRKGKRDFPDSRLSRFERILIRWGVITEVKPVYRNDERFAQIVHQPIRHAITQYLQWAKVKYRPSTAEAHRTSVLHFFLWVQQRFPDVHRLDGISRTIALDYGAFLQNLVTERGYGRQYHYDNYSNLRRFFDFVLEERLETAPRTNPFSLRDLPKKPEMLPRYLSDQDLRHLLAYCEREATLFERTLIITLLHTGIRIMEFIHLKVSDIVQIAGVWKLHIHEGKGLKDRMIPLTSQCLTVLQEWQEKGWERRDDHLFTYYGRPWKSKATVSGPLKRLGEKLGIIGLTAHRFRHTFAVALLNYGVRESALQKLMGHSSLHMTLEYARILDHTVEQSFAQAVEQMQEGAHSWVPNFFVQEDYTLFVEGDAISWIRLPVGYCRRNSKLHCESDVKCLLCERFAVGKEDLPRLQQMRERFLKLGLKIKAEVVDAQIRQLELLPGEKPVAFIPTTTIGVTPKHQRV